MVQFISAASAEFERLCQIVAQLRAPGGCPWDREQTNESILPQLMEEAYELVGAVRANDIKISAKNSEICSCTS